MTGENNHFATLNRTQSAYGSQAPTDHFGGANEKVALRFGSLFSGIGGLDLGLEDAGHRCAWQVEADPFCRRILKERFGAPVHEDVREVNWHDVEPVDLIAGGFPCQDLSFAGRGAGLAGARSGLWREMVRAIRLVGPRHVLVENVAALLARGMGTVLGDLADSRYDAEWDCLPAAAFGLPHRRFRLFVVAHAHGGRREGQPQPDGEAVQSAFDPRGWSYADGLAVAEHAAQEAAAVVQRMDDGPADRMDRLRAVGNAVVRPAGGWLGRRIA